MTHDPERLDREEVLDRTTFEDLVSIASVEQLPYKDCLDLRAHDAALREQVESLEADRERLMEALKHLHAAVRYDGTYGDQPPSVRIAADAARDLLDEMEETRR